MNLPVVDFFIQNLDSSVVIGNKSSNVHIYWKEALVDILPSWKNIFQAHSKTHPDEKPLLLVGSFHSQHGIEPERVFQRYGGVAWMNQKGEIRGWLSHWAEMLIPVLSHLSTDPESVAELSIRDGRLNLQTIPMPSHKNTPQTINLWSDLSHVSMESPDFLVTEKLDPEELEHVMSCIEEIDSFTTIPSCSKTTMEHVDEHEGHQGIRPITPVKNQTRSSSTPTHKALAEPQLNEPCWMVFSRDVEQDYRVMAQSGEASFAQAALTLLRRGVMTREPMVTNDDEPVRILRDQVHGFDLLAASRVSKERVDHRGRKIREYLVLPWSRAFIPMLEEFSWGQGLWWSMVDEVISGQTTPTQPMVLELSGPLNQKAHGREFYFAEELMHDLYDHPEHTVFSLGFVDQAQNATPFRSSASEPTPTKQPLSEAPPPPTEKNALSALKSSIEHSQREKKKAEAERKKQSLFGYFFSR